MKKKTDYEFRARIAEAIENPEAFLEMDAQLCENPEPLFRRTLEMFHQLPGKVDNAMPIRYPVRLVLSKELNADARTKRLRGFRCRYEITINSGFYNLLNDVAELTVAQERMISKAGHLITQENFSPDDLRTILKESVAEYVKKQNIWQPSKKLATNYKERLLRELRLRPSIRHEYSHFGRRLFMVAFALGHELGHIELGHCDSARARKLVGQQEELDADFVAAKFLTDFVAVPPKWWENRWEWTGNAYTDIFVNAAKWMEEKYYYMKGDGRSPLYPSDEIPQPPDYEICLASALIAIAALFGIYEATERCAVELGVSFDADYPSAKQRYEYFRQTSINVLGIPEEAFSTFRGLQEAPDRRFEIFQRLVEGISWADDAKSE